MPKIVTIPPMEKLIHQSPGFAKKDLSDDKLDVIGLCQFGCGYCSSNDGYYLRQRRRLFADLTEAQTGSRSLPADDPHLMFMWPDVVEQLRVELSGKKPSWGAGKTLVFSMQTDGFSPHLVGTGITENVLRLVLEKTSYRIRVLTKNSVVGTDKWIRFFEHFRNRFVVGLSIGTTDDQWARRVEQLTPSPSSRLKALQRLQDAGIPTYGMLCPVFPDVLETDRLVNLIDLVRPNQVEHVWAEPFNDRRNWMQVRNGYDVGSYGYDWFTNVYEHGRTDQWSNYATEIYAQMRDKARVEGWIGKLRYLLYERSVSELDAERFDGLEGVLLQCKPAKDGKSPNRHLARYRQPPLVNCPTAFRVCLGASGVKESAAKVGWLDYA